MLQGGFFLFVMGLSLALVIFVTEALRGCLSWLKNRFNKEEEETVMGQSVTEEILVTQIAYE